MSRILVDDFSHGLINGFWWITNTAPSVVTAKPGMSGSYCLQLLDGASVRRDLPATISDIYIAFKWWASENAYSYPCNIITFFNSSNQALAQMNKENTLWPGRFYFTRGLNGTWIATPQWPWYDIQETILVEIRYKPATDSSGELVLRINGREVVNYTGQNSNYAGPISAIHLGWVSTAFWKSHFCISDIVIDDAGFPGLTMFSPMFPSAAGNSAQWSPSSGSNWDCVEEVPGSLNQYVSEDTNGQLDLYTMTNPSFPETPSVIKGMQIHALSRKVGSPSVSGVKLSLRTNSTNYDSASKTPGTDASPNHINNYWATNPDDSAAWETSDLDNLEAGVKAAT